MIVKQHNKNAVFILYFFFKQTVIVILCQKLFWSHYNTIEWRSKKQKNYEKQGCENAMIICFFFI